MPALARYSVYATPVSGHRHCWLLVAFIGFFRLFNHAGRGGRAKQDGRLASHATPERAAARRREQPLRLRRPEPGHGAKEGREPANHANPGSLFPWCDTFRRNRPYRFIPFYTVSYRFIPNRRSPHGDGRVGHVGVSLGTSITNARGLDPANPTRAAPIGLPIHNVQGYAV